MNGTARPRRWRLWLTHGVLPVVAGVALLAWIEGSDLDPTWSDRFFRPELGGWYFRDAWWAEGLLHRGGRAAVVLFGLATAAWAVLPGTRRRAPEARRAAIYVVTVMAVCAVSIGALKANSPRPCPWDVDRYGGALRHLGLFEGRPEGARAGHCFPSAHAGTGYSLLGLYFALRDRSRRAAFGGLATAILVGTAFGFAQVARGAHFPSHVLASALWCWLEALAIYEWLLSPSRTAGAGRGRAAETDAASPATEAPATVPRYSRSAP